MERKLEEIANELEVTFDEIKENAADFSIDKIKNAQSKLKMLEAAIIKKKEQKKVKTLTISADVHSEVKKYCVDREIKMGEFVEDVLLDSIKEEEK